MAKFTLTYFGIGGRAEPIRLAFAIAGVSEGNVCKIMGITRMDIFLFDWLTVLFELIHISFFTTHLLLPYFSS